MTEDRHYQAPTIHPDSTFDAELQRRVVALERALDAAVEMIEEQATAFVALRDEIREALAKISDAPDRITPAQLLRESRRLEELIADVAQKVDPIAAFRARMRGTESAGAEVAGGVRCPQCGRVCATPQGLSAHRRNAHQESAS